MILKLDSFCNEKGMLVQQRTMVSGPPAPFHRFMGTVGVKVESGGMEMIEFPIDAETIEEAFERFKESADQKISGIRKEQEAEIAKEIAAKQQQQQQQAKPKNGLVVMRRPKKIILPGGL